MRGIVCDGDPCTPTGVPLPVYAKDNTKIGQIAAVIYTTRVKQNIDL